jgi:hypothetical protein
MIGFLGANAVVRPTSTTDLRQSLIDLGLYTTGGATPLNLNGGILTTAQAVITTGTITVSQPAIGGSYLFALQPYKFCARKVEPAQCDVGAMQSRLRGDKLYNALQGPAFGMHEHAVEPVDTCTTGADTTIDLP